MLRVEIYLISFLSDFIILTNFFIIFQTLLV